MNQWLISKVVMVNRLLRDDISKGQAPTRIHASSKDVWNALKDPSMLGLWIIGLLSYIPKAPVIQYLALNLRRMGFSTFTSNVLMIPSEFLRVLGLLVLARSSEHFNERAMHCIFAELFCVPLFATLLVLPAGGFRWARFAIATLITGGPTSFAIVVNWISRNSFDVRKRAVSIAIFGMFDLVGSVAAARKCTKTTYKRSRSRTDQRPRNLSRRRCTILFHREQSSHISGSNLVSNLLTASNDVETFES